MVEKIKAFKVSNKWAYRMFMESSNCKVTIYVSKVMCYGDRYCIINKYGKAYSVPIDYVFNTKSLNRQTAVVTIPTKIAALMM